jgi:ABC-type antimicrobial peptide transport system permease subunit
MPKGDHLAEFELFVMLAVARLGADDAYGVTIRQEIETRTSRSVSIGAVYATLGRLHDKGFVSFAFSDPDPVPGGRARKLVSAAVAPQRFRAAFIGSLALLALTLAVVGVYGVMSYAVSERTRELGIRMALGESPWQIRRRVIVEALALAALGTVIGSGGALLAARVLRSVMFEVGTSDPWTIATVAARLAVVTILAADGPARRAGRVDPIAAIRGD